MQAVLCPEEPQLTEVIGGGSKMLVNHVEGPCAVDLFQASCSSFGTPSAFGDEVRRTSVFHQPHLAHDDVPISACPAQRLLHVFAIEKHYRWHLRSTCRPCTTVQRAPTSSRRLSNLRSAQTPRASRFGPQCISIQRAHHHTALQPIERAHGASTPPPWQAQYGQTI